MPDELYRAIGERIRRARELLGLTQQDLSAKLGYTSAATVSLYEAGQRRIGVADLKRVAKILGVPVDYLLDEPAEDAFINELCLHFRAHEVRPTARDAVRAFISFAARNATESRLPTVLSKMNPGHAASKVRELADVTECAVSARAVAAALHVPIFEWDFPDEISGIVFACRNLVCIGINDNHPRVRQRFTLAHEIAHLVFDRKEELIFDFFGFEMYPLFQTEDAVAREVKANRFAADLLMPMEWVRADVQQHAVDLERLASKYEVSQQAMWFRLCSLKLVQPGSQDR